MSLILSAAINASQSLSRAMPCRPPPADPPSVSKYQPPHPPTVEDAERKGRLRPGGVIVEGTRGNTGISLALASLAKGYQCVLVVPDSVSAVKVDLMRAYGAHVHVQPSVPLSDSRHFYHKVSLLFSFPPSLPPSLPRYPPVPLLPPARKHGNVGETVPRHCRRRFSGQGIPYKASPGPSHTGQGGTKGLSGWRWGREEDASCLRLASGPFQPISDCSAPCFHSCRRDLGWKGGGSWMALHTLGPGAIFPVDFVFPPSHPFGQDGLAAHPTGAPGCISRL